MTYSTSARNIGDSVLVYDAKGNYECRGVIVGHHKIVGGDAIFDIQPNRQESLAKRICGLPSWRLRSVPQEVKAYEPKPRVDARHILDEA